MEHRPLRLRATGRRWRRVGRRGVSDVVATILLLALTVTLFASIFAFVTAFPAPPAQNNNQFQASLAFTANMSYVSAVHIVHLAGPVVAGNALIYLKSATQPTAPEFQNPYTVSSGLGGASVWNLGQVWNLTFATNQRPQATGNITIYVVASSQLLYSVILPGTSIVPPPTIVSTSISPTTPGVGASFTVYASIAGTYTAQSVFVNLAGVPNTGVLNTSQKMTQNSQGQWTFFVGAGLTTTSGTFYAFVNASSASGSRGQQAVGAVLISISTSGTVNGPLSVGVVLVPSPPNAGTAESVQAVVTYTGTTLSSPVSVAVSFSGTSSPSGYTYSGSGPSGITISGPSGPASVTVVSQSIWTIPSPASLTLYTFAVSATATVTGLGSITGTTTFTPATITVGPTSGLVASVATARGAGFLPSTSVTLSMGGVTIIPTGSSNSTCTFSGSTITTTSTGTFVCQFKVPNGVTAGAVNLLATDTTSGQNDTAAFTVTSWTIAVTPSSGILGATVTARGAGFAASSSVVFTFDGITINPSGSSNSTCTFFGLTITTTSTGSFVCQFVIPYGATPPTGTAIATDSTTGQVATSSSFTVTAWAITTSPTTLAHGTAQKVYVNGTGFAVSSLLSLALNGTLLASGTWTFTCATTGAYSGSSLSGSTITTTSGGAFSCSFTMPKAAAAGIYSFTASDYTSGQVASVTFSRT